MRVVAGIVGVALILVMISEFFVAFLLPRRVRRDPVIARGLSRLLWLPWRAWRVLVHGVLGWVMFPLRYIDLALLRTSRAGQIGNHCFLWLRKP